MKLNRQNIHECTTPNGGWNKAQLAVLGITWPPERGWISRLEGKEISDEEFGEVKRLATLRVKAKKIDPIGGNGNDRTNALTEARDAAIKLARSLSRLIELEKS